MTEWRHSYWESSIGKPTKNWSAASFLLLLADPHVATIERMMQAVVRATQQLVQRQSSAWQGTIGCDDHWNRLFASVGEQMQGTLAVAMERSLQSHATDGLVQKGVVEQIARQWETV